MHVMIKDKPLPADLSARLAALGRALGRPFRRHRFESRALRQFLDFRILEHRLLARRYPGG
jgi:hypothetical protein